MFVTGTKKNVDYPSITQLYKWIDTQSYTYIYVSITRMSKSYIVNLLHIYQCYHYFTEKKNRENINSTR